MLCVVHRRASSMMRLINAVHHRSKYGNRRDNAVRHEAACEAVCVKYDLIKL
jgi:hypothetical protein